VHGQKPLQPAVNTRPREAATRRRGDAATRRRVGQVQVPWAEPNSRFTLLFEALAIRVLKQTSVSGGAPLLGVIMEPTRTLTDRTSPPHQTPVTASTPSQRGHQTARLRLQVDGGRGVRSGRRDARRRRRGCRRQEPRSSSSATGRSSARSRTPRAGKVTGARWRSWLALRHQRGRRSRP